VRGDLPPSWVWAPLSDLGTWYGGGTPSKANLAFWSNATIPWVSPKDMKLFRIRDSEDHITREAVEQSATNLIPVGSVLLVTRSGILRHSLPVAITEIPTAINQDLKALVPHNWINSTYLAYSIQAFESEILSKTSKNGTTVQSIEFYQLLSLELPIAPPREQERIVREIEKQISRIDAAIENLNRARMALKRCRASTLKAACEGRLVPTEAELARAEGRGYESGCSLLASILKERGITVPSYIPPHMICEGWAEATVEELASVGTGATPLRANVDFYKSGTIPWVTSSALNNAYVTETREFVTEKALRETNLTIYPKGTLLVAMYGEGKTRGKCSELLIEACTNQAIAAIVTTGLAAQCRSYLKLFFQKNYEDLRRLASGGVQPNLNLSLIKSLQVPLPPLAEQRRIVAEVERLLSVAEHTEAIILESLGKANALRNQILMQAFSGTLVPQNDGDEPASVLLEKIRQSRAAAAADRPRRGRGVKPGVSTHIITHK
jgi:type I restriction enzyme, S subunit